MNQFSMYTKDNCAYCVAAKNLLKSKGLVWMEHDVGKNQDNLDFLKRLVPGVRTVPQIFVDDKHIGGFEQLQEYFKNEDKIIRVT